MAQWGKDQWLFFGQHSVFLWTAFYPRNTDAQGCESKNDNGLNLTNTQNVSERLAVRVAVRETGTSSVAHMGCLV